MMEGYKYTHLIFAADLGWVAPSGGLKAIHALAARPAPRHFPENTSSKNRNAALPRPRGTC